MFFERLNDDELLDELVRNNDVDLEKVLYTSIDSDWGQHGVLVMNELLKHFLKDDVVELFSITMRITNNWQTKAIDVNCKIEFSYKIKLPTIIEIGDNVKFNYKDNVGRQCDNLIFERGSSVRRMESTFEVRTVDDLVDMTFKIFEQLLKEGTK